MATITSQGIETRSVEDYTRTLSESLSQALNLPAIDLEVETPQRQLVSSLAAALARVDQEMVDLFNAGSIYTATGDQMDSLTNLFGVFRRPARPSTATVTFTGTAGTTVPVGIVLRSTQEDLFVTTAAGTIPTGMTTVDVPVASQDSRPVSVAANEINELVNPVSGITSVTNAADGVLGRNLETDLELRNRFFDVQAQGTIGSVDSIRAAVRTLDGVTHCEVRDNTTASDITVGTVTVPSGSVLVVVDGGTNQDIANRILLKKPAGVRTVGNVTQSGSTPSGVNESIRFQRIVDIPIVITATLTTDASFTDDARQGIVEGLVDFVAQLRPGEALDQARAQAVILAFSGFDISSISFTQKTGGANLPADVSILNRLTLAESDVTLTTS